MHDGYTTRALTTPPPGLRLRAMPPDGPFDVCPQPGWLLPSTREIPFPT